MTDVFALDTEGQAELERIARANAVPIDALNQATSFEGTFLGIGDGLARGAARVAQTAGIALAAPFSLYERATDQEGRFTDPIFRATDDYATNAVDYFTPGPAEVGKAGQILGGLAEIAIPLMVAGGNPAALVATQTAGPAVDLVRQGVSVPAAAAVGALQGASTYLGFHAPILGSALATRLATGVGGNLALNLPTVAAQRAVLEGSGTPEAQQAAQSYNPFTAESAALDVLTGLAFGGLTHVGVRAAEREAALTANNARHFQLDTAPGAPRDMASFIAHQRAMEQATEQLVRGEPVTLPASIAEADFEPRITPDPEATLASLREVLPEGERAVTEVKPPTEPTPEATEGLLDEASPTPLAPGDPFLVFRAADKPGLENANAGNALAVADLLSRLDDPDRPLPVGAEKTDTVYVYPVAHQEGFAPYTRYSRGAAIGEDKGAGLVGRDSTPQGVTYSFPGGGKFQAGEPVAIPVKEILERVKRSGPDIHSFDDAGTLQVAKVLREIAQEKLSERRGPPDRSDKAIEARFAEQLAKDPADAEAQYAANPESKGGKVLNTDTARELSPDYLHDRTRSAAVHEPASDFIKKLYAKKLAEAPKPGEEPEVLFTAGGTGAGKSTSIKGALGGIADTAQIVYDTNMNGYESSVKKIDQALAAGKRVVIAYTVRDPIKALKEGALPRAMRQEREFGTGRTVPMETHLETHLGAAEAIPRIAKRYADNPDVTIRVIDNNRGPDGLRLASLSDIPAYDYTQLREQAIRTLDEERAAGRISESVYRGFAQANEPRGVQGVLQPARPGARGQPESQREGGDGRGPEAPGSDDTGTQPRVRGASGPDRRGADGQSEPQRKGADPNELTRSASVDPDVRAAFDALATRDFEIPTGELDPDGRPLTISARQLMADASAALERAKADAPAFEAAVSCFLRGGNS